MAFPAGVSNADIYSSKFSGFGGFDASDFGGKRRFAAGGTPRQQRSSPLDYVGNRQVQGEVTQTLPFDVHLDRARAKNTQNSANIRTLGQVTNPEQVYIRENQLLFRPVERRAVFGPLLAPPKNKPLASLQVFSMFNGLEIAEERFPTQFDFDNSFEFAGVAKTNIPFGRPEVDGTTVAAIVAGAVTIHNDGDTTFMPGDVITARLPEIDPARRRLATAINAYHTPIGNEGCPTIEREHPSRMYELAQNEMEKYVDRVKPSEQKAFLTQSVGADVYPIAITPQERFFKNEYVRGTAADAWLYITTAAQAGIVSFNLPDGTNPASLSALSKPGIGLDKLSLSKLLTQTATLDPTTGILDLKASSAADRTALWTQARILAGLLGLEEYGGVAQVPALRDLFLRRRCAGFLGKFADRYQRETMITQAAAPSLQNNPTLAEKHLWALQRDRATESWEAFWKIYRALSRFRIGRAIGYGPKGGDVDLLM